MTVSGIALGQILSQSMVRNGEVAAPVQRSPRPDSPARLSSNLNRLISAAVVSPRFRRLLLSDPAAALAAGYNGERFQLSPAEYAAVTSLHAGTIRDFAAQLLRVLQYTSADAARNEQKAPTDFHFAEAAT